MSLGRKSDSKKSDIKIPQAITSTVYNSPTGDQYISRSQGGSQNFTSNLSPGTQATVNESLSGLQNLARELNAPDNERIAQINTRSRDYYDLQSAGINQDLDDTLARTKSDLNKRFGGSYNATFGTDLLANIEKSRVNQLEDARKQASLYGEDLYQRDEDSRMQRFTLFQNYLSDLNNQARGLQSSGAATLNADRQLQSNAGLQRQELIERYNIQGDAQARKDKETAMRLSSQLAGLYLL